MEYTIEMIQQIHYLLIKEGHMDSAHYPITNTCREVLEAVGNGWEITYTQDLYEGNSFSINRPSVSYFGEPQSPAKPLEKKELWAF